MLFRSTARKTAETEAFELLDSVGMKHAARRYPESLSGGEQQRVAIARAIVADPSIVLADEPTAALDGGSGRTIMRLLKDTAREFGQGVLVVTHDPRVVPFADRIIHIEDGLLVETPAGEPERVRLPKAGTFAPVSASKS